MITYRWCQSRLSTQWKEKKKKVVEEEGGKKQGRKLCSRASDGPEPYLELLQAPQVPFPLIYSWVEAAGEWTGVWQTEISRFIDTGHFGIISFPGLLHLIDLGPSCLPHPSAQIKQLPGLRFSNPPPHPPPPQGEPGAHFSAAQT